MTPLSLLFTCASFVAGLPSTPSVAPRTASRRTSISVAPRMSSLDNGVIKVGVDLNMGGVITYMSRSSDTHNVINLHDYGREIQQSYYAGPTPFGHSSPDWPNWPWNPIGAGDAYGTPSTVVASANDGKTLYVRAIGMQWALNDVPCECFFETWIALDGHAANVRYRLTNHRSDLTAYDAYGQELPAVYTIGKLWHLITYDGPAPFTGDAVREVPFTSAPPWENFQPTESWMAWVNDAGFGLGVLNTGVSTFLAGFAGTPNVGGPDDDPTGYIAPVRGEVLDHNIAHTYEVSLVLGTVSEIREYAVAHRRGETRPDLEFPDRIQEDRQSLAYFNARDAGLPFRGPLRLELDRPDPQIYLPAGRWDAAGMPTLYIEAAFHSPDTSAAIFWAGPGEDFSEARVLSFPVVGDGKFRTYAVDLSSHPAYRGVINRLRFDPGDGGVAGAYVEIGRISFRPDSGPARSPRVVVRSP